jgi:hypothetical protein
MNFFRWLFPKRRPKILEVPDEFLLPDPPDWLLELKVEFLPGGDNFNVRVRLSAASKGGSAGLRIQPRAGNGDPQEALVNLMDSEAARLLVLLGFSFPDDITDVGEIVIDGVPAKLRIHQREPYAVKEGDTNLIHWPDPKKSHPPTLEIILLLIGVFDRAFPGKKPAPSG